MTAFPRAADGPAPILEVRDLEVAFTSATGHTVRPVCGVEFVMRPGQRLDDGTEVAQRGEMAVAPARNREGNGIPGAGGYVHLVDPSSIGSP